MQLVKQHKAGSPTCLRVSARVRGVLAGLLLAFACCSATAHGASALDIACTIEEREGIHSFHVTCSGELPDGTMIRAEISFLKPVPLPPALQKETGRQFDLVPVTIGKSVERMRGGKANFVIGIMYRKPYPGEYVLSVSCPRQGQKEDVLTKLGDLLPINIEKKFVIGKPEDFEVESKAVRSALRADLQEMKELLRRLDALFRARAFSGAAGGSRQEPLGVEELKEWTTALAEWTRNLQALLERNDKRPDLEVFWAEFVGKRTISLRADLLHKLAEGYDSALNALPISAEKLQDLQASSDEIRKLLQMDFEYFGFGKLLDTQMLLALVADIRTDLRKYVVWGTHRPSESAPEDLEKWKTSGDEIYEGLVVKTMELLKGLQGVSFHNVRDLTEAIADIRRIVRNVGPEGDTATAARNKESYANEILERIEQDVKAEASR